ncbi:MAG: bifunctional pyr operon transcriptional regulator/uracil phosphoribosyltransferase PyrR, partial [Candidatus Dormibacteria bacterium]
MRPEPLASSQARPLLGAEDIQPLLWRLSRELQERHPQGGVVLCGIVTRGVFLAARLLALVQQGPAAGWAGARLDCGPYRDDGARPPDPATFPLPQAGPAEVEGRPVVLVDDVLFHGR